MPAVAFGASVPDGAQEGTQIEQEATEITEGGGTGDGGPGSPAGLSAQALVAIVVPLLLGLFKGWLPIKWRKYLPLLAPIVGEILTQAINLVGANVSLPGGAGMVAGLAGVGVREGMKRGGPIRSGAAMILLGLVFIGCARLQPGADPIVVRAEQAARLADANFGVFLRLENDQRAFYRTNAPNMHAFAEWLRARQPVTFPDGTRTNVARADAMIVNLINVKRAYQNSRSHSNLLITATLTLGEAATQAAGWNNLITNKTGATRPTN